MDRAIGNDNEKLVVSYKKPHENHPVSLCPVILLATGCKKNTCNRVTIVDTGIPCIKWGIKTNNAFYPADSIADQFKHDGMVVCTKYELYEDLRLCPSPCCSGTRAKIISMSQLPD